MIPQVFEEGGDRCFILATLRYDNPYTQRLLKTIISGDIPLAQDILKLRYDEFYIDCLITVITKGYYKVNVLNTVVEASAQTLKNQKYINKRYMTKRFLDPNTKSYKELKTIVKNYNLRAPAEEVKNIPYLNFDDNKSDINCVKNYANEKYSKIKTLSKYFDKEDVPVEVIENFCNDYKIKLNVKNLDDHIIFSNGLRD